MSGLQPILFVDRDGTLIEEPEDCLVDCYQKLRLVAGVIPAMLQLRDAGYVFVMVSNQDGLGTPDFPREQFDGPQQLLLQLLASQGIEFREVLIDTSWERDGAPTRKPGIGLVQHYLRDRGVDWARSAMVGDRDTDCQFARNLGVRGFHLRSDRFGGDSDWNDVVRALLAHPRSARVVRTTRETTIEAEVNLDRTDDAQVATGLRFFDHMLEQLGKHGGFWLRLRCRGDLDVDEHHTVEDCALVIGQTLREALGAKRGIDRYGFTLPMDEALASAAIDLSGRGLFRFSGKFSRERVGELPTELVSHFFRSLAEAAGMTLHLTVNGENDHHQIEACFKVVGRALRQAIHREGQQLPSTKGCL